MWSSFIPAGVASETPWRNLSSTSSGRRNGYWRKSGLGSKKWDRGRPGRAQHAPGDGGPRAISPPLVPRTSSGYCTYSSYHGFLGGPGPSPMNVTPRGGTGQRPHGVALARPPARSRQVIRIRSHGDRHHSRFESFPARGSHRGSRRRCVVPGVHRRRADPVRSGAARGYARGSRLRA